MQRDVCCTDGWLPVLLPIAVAAVEIAPGIEWVPGAFEAGKQPDGNIVVLREEGP